MSKIWIAGKGFDVDARVIRWDEGPGFDASKHRCINPSRSCPGGGVLPYSQKSNTNIGKRRYGLRPALRQYGHNPPLLAAQSVIKQFVLHHDGCPSAKSCFNVLHNERGFSAHFLLDNDGTIYQTLDLSLMAYHAARFNSNSIGVEICNRGNAKKDPKYYSRKNKKRDIVTCRIHDHTYLCFDFTPAQKDAMRALAKGLARALPNLPLDYPQETPGRQSWTVIPNAKRYSGYLGHYHTTRRKWDPGPFDFKNFCDKIRGSLCFPLSSGKKTAKPPVIPENQEKLSAQTKQLFQSAEGVDAGFFPVGPYGKSRLWHGGIHLPTEHLTPVFAALPGRVVVARMSKSSLVGSQNFVLIRHEMSFGDQTVRFFSLYYHLQDELGSRGKPMQWMKEAGAALVPGQVSLLDIPVEGSQQIGRAGKAGPDFKPQLHVEIFSADEVSRQLKSAGWKVVDGTAGGRFCTNDALLKEIDTSRDGKFSRQELLDFFRGRRGDAAAARQMVTLHVSEWAPKPDWSLTLKHSDEFKDLSDEELTELVDQQITPTLWWTPAVANHAKLPRDGVVYHYHPITLLRAITQKTIESNALAANGVNAFSVASASGPPPGVTDDIGDVSGESFVDESELKEVDLGHHLTLEDLANGYPEP